MRDSEEKKKQITIKKLLMTSKKNEAEDEVKAEAEVSGSSGVRKHPTRWERMLVRVCTQFNRHLCIAGKHDKLPDIT